MRVRRVLSPRSWLRGVLATAAALALAGAGTAASAATDDDRIVGGEPTTIEEHPYQLSLQSSGAHICGASILSPTRALTAAHCTDGQSPSSLSVRAGSTYRGTGGQVIGVDRIDQHPGYDPETTDYDVSVLELSTPITLGPGAQPVTLPAPGKELPDGTMATVSGWGTVAEGGSLPVRLQRVSVPKYNTEECRASYGAGAITDRMVCHGYREGGKDSCQGDSGGPLATRVKGVTRLVGVVSWGYGCARPGFPGVYAKVSDPELHDYITSHM